MQRNKIDFVYELFDVCRVKEPGIDPANSLGLMIALSRG